MKAVFGIVFLVIVLAVVGWLSSRQMKAVSQAPAAAVGAASVPAGNGNVREQSQQIQDKVRNDVNNALQQGARKEEPEQ